MTISRRKFLTVIGSSAVIFAAGSAAYLGTRTPTGALAPWKSAGSGYAEPRRNALSYAILAPNPHNRQPWLVDLVGTDEIVLYCDLQRLIRETDPYERQITIGLGCFLEILRMAAAAQGYRADITPFPDGAPGDNLDQRPIAHIKLVTDSDTPSDPLFGSVLQRRTNREAYDSARPVEPSKLAVLEGAATGRAAIGTISGDQEVAMLRDLTWRAMVVELETPRTYMESVDLMRIGKAEIEANPDGISLGTPFLNALYALGMISRDEIADPASSAYRQGIDMLRPAFETAMAYGLVTTPGNSRLDQLDAGRTYVRLHLQAVVEGLALQPLSQSLEEYPEMTGLFTVIHEKLDIPDGSRLQMLARLGYGPQIGPSPRWPLESRVRIS
ncbi:MAG: hypothetical protein K8F25_05635 [Fimbriimonadaceae bacterium]|nr:hypothetical protein [Alphaproteobacteria bacterium]